MTGRTKSTIIEEEGLFKEFCSNRELSTGSIKVYKYALQDILILQINH